MIPCPIIRARVTGFMSEGECQSHKPCENVMNVALSGANRAQNRSSQTRSPDFIAASRDVWRSGWGTWQCAVRMEQRCLQVHRCSCVCRQFYGYKNKHRACREKRFRTTFLDSPRSPTSGAFLPSASVPRPSCGLTMPAGDPLAWVHAWPRSPCAPDHR